MKWFVIVFFATMHPDGTTDSFVFMNPTYGDESSCRATLTDENEIARYVMGLIDAYSGAIPGPIDKVNCIPEDLVDKIFESDRVKQGKHTL